MEHYTYLAHYGIPKQQWGVRRFQNPDGSLTPEGRRRYGVGDASLKATDKANRYKAKADSYRYKASIARAKYNPDKAARLELKANRYEAKSSRSNAQASKLALRDSRIANSKFKESDVYAMEGAKRAGLLGAAVGKAVGVYKEHKERRQDQAGLTKDERKIFDDAKKYEETSIYDFSVNSRLKPLSQRVKDTEDQLQKICDANVKKLSDVMKSIPGRNPYDDVDSLYDGGFAVELATRMNERFDVDHILDQHMDEYVLDYREGRISKKEFKQHYDTELNDYAARVVDGYSSEDLKRIAKTFVDTDGYNAGEYGDASPKTGWKDYLKRVDSWEGVDSNSLNRQNSKKSSQYAVKNPPKSSGRYTTGRNENSSRGSMMDIVSQDKKNWRVTTNKKGERGAEYIGPGNSVDSQIKSLRNAGYTYREIEQTLGVSSSKIAEILS